MITLSAHRAYLERDFLPSFQDTFTMSSARLRAHRIQLLVVTALLMVGWCLYLVSVNRSCPSPSTHTHPIHPTREIEPIQNLRQNFLVSPPNPAVKFAKTNITYYAQVEQDKIVDELLKAKTHGFFFEAGAYDGQALSNTLFFERYRHWTGLLIEANPKLFQVLKSRNRDAYLSNTCISTVSYATKLNFTFADYLGGIEATNDKSMISGSDLVQCFPIDSYFQALNIREINYFSLDVEGAEYEILKQIDFHRIKIDLMTIEYAVKYPGNPESRADLDRIRKLILGTGLYREVMDIKQLPTEKFSRKNRGLPRYSPPRYQPVNLHRNSQTVNEVF